MLKCKYLAIALTIVTLAFIVNGKMPSKATPQTIAYNTNQITQGTIIEPIKRRMNEYEFRYALIHEMRLMRETIESMNDDMIDEVFYRLDERLPSYIWRGDE